MRTDEAWVWGINAMLLCLWLCPPLQLALAGWLVGLLW